VLATERICGSGFTPANDNFSRKLLQLIKKRTLLSDESTFRLHARKADGIIDPAGGSNVSAAWSAGSALVGIYNAMRKRGNKTVIPAQNTVLVPGLDRGDLDYLFSVTYEELRRLAASVKSGDPSATLNPTTLVHEAWLRLASSPAFVSTSRLHFKRIAARAMRQLLVESARRRSSQKRGGGAQGVFVTFDEALIKAACCDEDVLKLDVAMDELARLNPRQAVMVESRFFGGLDISETAELLAVSEATILRDWRAAKAWLAHELRQGD